MMSIIRRLRRALLGLLISVLETRTLPSWLQRPGFRFALHLAHLKPISGGAHTVVMDGYITMGGTNFHTDTMSFSSSHSVELVEDTVFGDNFHQRLIGLQDYQMSWEAENDHADDALDEDVEALIATNFAVAWRASDGAISTSNPEYQFTGSFSNVTKTYVMGQIAKISGAIAMTTTAAVTRDVAP